MSRINRRGSPDSPVYTARTGDILVRVSPAYSPEESSPDTGRWIWIYTIEIENRSARPVRLLTRHWRISEATGDTHEVDGEGVVGKQPLLRPGEAFQYTSGCPLSSASGIMRGIYRMLEPETGRVFDVEIPAFALDSPASTKRAN